VGGNVITGFVAGTMVEHRMDQDFTRDAEGVDGEPARWRRNNPFSALTLHLRPSSNSNFVMSTMFNVDRLTMAGLLPVLVEDRSGGGTPTRLLAGNAWVQRMPDLTWSDVPAPRAWTLRMINVVHDVQGYEETV
jgi:hypothetical protein